MIKTIDLRVPYKYINDEGFIKNAASKDLKVELKSINHIERLKQSLDARGKNIVYNLKLEVYIEEDFVEKECLFTPQDVSNAKEIGIIGAGPAGLFAALNAIEKGLKPIIFERGKDVREREALL